MHPVNSPFVRKIPFPSRQKPTAADAVVRLSDSLATSGAL